MPSRRRAARTIASIRAALIRGLRTAPYDRITVVQLAEAAEVGRSTFYSHFSGKDDLLRASLRMLHDEIAEASQSGPSLEGAAPYPFLRPLFAHVASHRELYRNLKGRGARLFVQEMSSLIERLLRRDGAHGLEPGEWEEVRLQFARASILGLLLWWLDHGAGRPALPLADRIGTLLLHGLAGPSEAD